MQIASPGGDIPPSSMFSRAIGPLSPLLATTYWLPLKMLQWSNKCMVKQYASPLWVYNPGRPMAQCIIFLWTIIWSQYPNLWEQCSPSHHPFDSGDPANTGVTLSLIPLLSIGGPANMGVTIPSIPIHGTKDPANAGVEASMDTWTLGY